jgi:hypothetical protein
MLKQLTHEHIRIHNGRQPLQACLTYNDAPRGIACIAGPHPLMGGSMQNNVVRTLSETLPQAGIATLTFDYSGFSADEATCATAVDDRLALIAEFWSAGRTSHDKQMVCDVTTAWAWARANVKGVGMLVGYSFGAYAVHQIVEPAPDAVVLVCPTLIKHAFQIREDSVSTYMLYGDRDFSCPVETAEAYTRDSRCAKSQVIPGSDHFLRDYETLAADLCLNAARRAEGVTV